MKELIKLSNNTSLGQVVSARELYEFLEVKTEFSHWCKRMFEYGFEEGEDYQGVVVKNDGNSKGGRSTLTDYALTIDTAKEISMIQRNEKGRQARRYFIECERIVRAKSIFTIENGRIMTDSKLLSEATKTPHESIIKDIKKWIEMHCDIILEGDPIYFNKYRLLPKRGKGGVIGKMLCSNVFVSKEHKSPNLVYHMADVAILRFLERHASDKNVRNMLPIFKDQVSRKEIELSSVIWNFSLPEVVTDSDISVHNFLSERAGMFSNFEYSKRCYEEFCRQNDIPRKTDWNYFKAEYLRFGNKFK